MLLPQGLEHGLGGGRRALVANVILALLAREAKPVDHFAFGGAILFAFFFLVLGRAALAAVLGSGARGKGS